MDGDLGMVFMAPYLIFVQKYNQNAFYNNLRPSLQIHAGYLSLQSFNKKSTDNEKKHSS